MIAIDLRGTFLSMKYELKKMKAQGFGSIVNISSDAGLVGAAGFSGYTAEKHERRRAANHPGGRQGVAPAQPHECDCEHPRCP